MSDRPLVIEDALRLEVAERDEIKRKIADLSAQLERKEKRISMALELLGDTQQDASQFSPKPATQETVITPSAPSLTLMDAVPLVLKKFGPLKPGAIKPYLADVGFTNSYNDNYFYTVLSRLNKTGVIGRTADRRLACPAPDAGAADGGSMH